MAIRVRNFAYADLSEISTSDPSTLIRIKDVPVCMAMINVDEDI